MPEDDAQQRQTNVSRNTENDSTPPARRSDWKNVFSLPKPLKDIFDKFPLVTYPPNDDPIRAPSNRDQHVLHVFTTEDGAAHNAPSFNPSCLKWQVFLKSRSISFTTVLSNNHASPSGSLPFLIPAHTTSNATPKPIPSNRLERWATTDKPSNSKPDVRASTHAALIDHSIRRAWLYQLYISSGNFTHVAQPLYVNPVSTNTFVRATISHQLQRAALDELRKTTPTISEPAIIEDGCEAFAALSTVLGEDEWFFGREEMGLLDAAVFAYTCLLLDEGFGWRENGLGDAVRGCGGGNLVRHCERIRELYFP